MPSALKVRKWRWTSLRGRIDDVAEEIAAGQPKALVAFTDAVCDLLSTEHKQ
jgi:hypothetical protein